jgi:hypothetical protein
VDLEKVEVIREWSALRNVVEARSFMGLVGYYKRFIAGFSKIAHPITSCKGRRKHFSGLKSVRKFSSD